jgi:hypothetical protein
MLHMQRGEFELAYGYLKEAYSQYPGDPGIRNRYVKALNKFCASLDGSVIEHREQNNQSIGHQTILSESYSSPPGARFWQDYVSMMNTLGSMGCRSDLEDERSPNDGQQGEWSSQSYIAAIYDPGFTEVESTPSNPSNRLSELPGNEVRQKPPLGAPL